MAASTKCKPAIEYRWPYSKAYRRGYADCVAGEDHNPFPCGTREWSY